MNITVNEEILKQYNLSIEEFLVLYLCARDINIEETIKSLLDKKLVEKDLYNKIAAVTSTNTNILISNIIISSDKAVINREEEFLETAKAMIAEYPKGRKPGTTYSWRDSPVIIAHKLKTIVAKFDVKFTLEEAVAATRRYVAAFNGNYQFMQLLKYFILKTDKSTGELRSDFLSELANSEENINVPNDNGELV